jgi:uncharacterized protein (TIGR02145 family)
MQCTKCKSEILATAKFCPECGNKVEKMGKTCHNKDCKRSNLPLEAMYCPDCGTELSPQKLIGELLFGLISKETKQSNNLQNANKKVNRQNEVVWQDQKNGYFIDDEDKERYKVVKIGKQVWMAENLRRLFPYGCRAYDNNKSNVIAYGYLYDWESALKSVPSGWHLPTVTEFQQLAMVVANRDERFIKTDFRDTGITKKIKSRNGWMNTLLFIDNNGNNQSGFNIFPNGLGTSDDNWFGGKGSNAHLWTASSNSDNEAFDWWIEKDIDGFFQTPRKKSHLLGVRCVQNEIMR